MPGRGRNDPCPCGSGKKYKHCCLTRTQTETGITEVDRTEAMAALVRHMRRDEFADLVGDAALAWAPDDFGDDAQAAFDTITEEMTSLQMFLEWLFFDLPQDAGRTFGGLFLDGRGRSVGPRAADYIRLMQGTHLRPYLIRRVRLDAGFEVRDLWSGDELFVDERTATHDLAIWDILVARVVSEGDGSHHIEGTMMALPPAVEADLMKALKREHRAFLRAVADGTDVAFFKQQAPPVFHDLWYASVGSAAPPEMRTVEGDPVTTSRLVFDVPQAQDALAILGREPDFEPDDDGRCAWLEADAEPRRLLGELSAHDDTLVLVTFSRERAARGRRRLEAALGPLHLRSEEHHEAGSGPPPAEWAEDGDADEIDDDLDPQDLPEVQEWLAQKDREWLDLDIPALDGKTPREAAKDRRLRPRLRSLLMEIENGEARMAGPGHARDLSWLWHELRLKRP